MSINWKALWEAVKEPLRLLILALVSWGIVELAQLDTQWAVVGVFVLRFIDKWMHEAGKERTVKNTLLEGGLTRF